jgi:hypothetical protein
MWSSDEVHVLMKFAMNGEASAQITPRSRPSFLRSRRRLWRHRQRHTWPGQHLHQSRRFLTDFAIETKAPSAERALQAKTNEFSKGCAHHGVVYDSITTDHFCQLVDWRQPPAGQYCKPTVRVDSTVTVCRGNHDADDARRLCQRAHQEPG